MTPFSISGFNFHSVGPSHLGTKPCIALLGLTWLGLTSSDDEACSES